MPVHREHSLEPSPYIPSSFQDCVEQLLIAGLPEIVSYDGYKDIQRGIAEEIAHEVYRPREDLDTALAMRAMTQIFEAEKSRRNRTSDRHLAAVVVGLSTDIATGEHHIVVGSAQPSRMRC